MQITKLQKKQCYSCYVLTDRNTGTICNRLASTGLKQRR